MQLFKITKEGNYPEKKKMKYWLSLRAKEYLFKKTRSS